MQQERGEALGKKLEKNIVAGRGRGAETEMEWSIATGAGISGRRRKNTGDADENESEGEGETLVMLMGICGRVKHIHSCCNILLQGFTPLPFLPPATLVFRSFSPSATPFCYLFTLLGRRKSSERESGVAEGMPRWKWMSEK